MNADFAIARRRMVREQLRGQGLDDERVLTVMSEVPRHLFVPKLLRHRAYHGCALPIGHEQTISQPFIVGLMTTLLELQGHEHVLEVGTGSGYQAAILAQLCRSVVSVERIRPLALGAAHRLHELGVDNVEVYASDGGSGIPEHGPYDAVIATACPERLPSRLFHELKDGGVLVLPIGRGEEQILYRYRRLGDEAVIERSVPCRFVPMLEGLTGEVEHA